jgi:hypothetical protein
VVGAMARVGLDGTDPHCQEHGAGLPLLLSYGSGGITALEPALPGGQFGPTTSGRPTIGRPLWRR